MISKEYYLIIKATKIYKQRLGDMTEQDAWHEGGYTLKEYKDVWRDINGEWDDEQIVTVVAFSKVGKGNTPIPDEWREVGCA